jgi:hypothetical protein
MTNRRRLLTASAAALAASAIPVGARSKAIGVQREVSEHFVRGGTRGIQRGQYTFTPTSNVEGYGAIAIPDTVNTFMIPLTKTVFDESEGTKYQLKGDGLVTVMKDDLYQITANLDWPAQPRGSGQDGYDTNLRKILVKRVPVGVAPPVYKPGEVTKVAANGKLYDGVAMQDMPGSSAPNTVRAVIDWAPGSIAAGGMAFIDVTLPVGSFTPKLEDFVRASHASLSDAILGAANAGLVLSARMVGPRVARVMIENRYNAGPVFIPAGTMSLLAESSVSSAGNNSDSWTYVNSGPIYLLAGEKLMIIVRSLNPGDFLQIVNASFLRISNVVA